MLNFSEYNEIYKDLAEQDFARFLFEAECMLDNWTAGRYKNVEGYKAGRVKNCLIWLIRELSLLNDCDPNVKSVSNDGYSETYESFEDIKERLKLEGFEYLSGTGLVSYL